MARRATSGAAGRFLPQLGDGIRARAAHLASGFSGIATQALDELNLGDKVILGATAVWVALFTVDQPEADAFFRRYAGPWTPRDEPVFAYDPITRTLADLGGQT
jgi:hypothetical protein